MIAYFMILPGASQLYGTKSRLEQGAWSLGSSFVRLPNPAVLLAD